MKTLKKTLCLVLAVVMVVGVLILPAYAADDYTAAITALQNYGVLQGYPDGDLHTAANITRGQMAAIIYRIMTGDTGSTDAEVAVKYGSYADRFTDADVAPWAKGYIGFCYNKGVLKGYDTGAVQPNKQINGYEVQAMLLRALGYDSNGEYTGNNWQYNVLSDATKSGISKNVSLDPAKATPRGAVAQYTFDAATKTDRVAPTLYPNVGYASISKKLMSVTTSTDVDDWKAPCTVYTVTYTWPDTPVVSLKTVADKALLESWAPVSQAAVYTAAKLTTTTYNNTLKVYTNGVANAVPGSSTPTTVSISRTETSLAPGRAIGGQGRWTRVYADRIVYVDTFLTYVNSADAAVEIGGNAAIPASYQVTTYYNNYYDTTPVAYSGVGGTGSGQTKTLGNAPISFAKKDYLASYAVPVSGVTAGTTYTGTAFSDNTQISKLVDPAKITPVNVTVSAIIKSDGAATITGLKGTDGKTYLYNCTYAYNDGKNIARLGDTAIGKTYSLYLDAHDNILGVKEVAGAPDEGAGVITGTVTPEKIGAGAYAAVVTVLKEDKTTATVKFVPGAVAYGTSDVAERAADAAVGALVNWEPATGDYSDYSVLHIAAAEAIDGSGTTANPWRLEAGDADAIGTAAEHKLVNSDTVFFIAKWSLDYSKNGYVFAGYDVVEGFENIADLSSESTYNFASAGNPYVVANGAAGKPANYAMASTPNNYRDGIRAAVLDGDGAVISNNSKAWAGYVLIINAANQSTNTVEPVSNYAFITDPVSFVNVYQNYRQYDAVINGVAHQPLNVMYIPGTTEITATGLYTYSEYTNNGWKNVTISGNTYGTGDYNYQSGVLFSTVAGATAYYAVTIDVAIYLVNPDNGDSTKVSTSLSNVVKYYKDKSPIWFQTNQYGWIDVIYVEATDVAPEVSGKRDATVTGVAFSNIGNMNLISNAKVTATGTNIKSTTTLKWEYFDGGFWKPVEDGQCFTASVSYRAYITFAPSSSSYAVALTPGATGVLTGRHGLPGGTASTDVCTSADTIYVQFTYTA